MNPIRTTLLLTATACLFQMAARANDIEPGKEFYTVVFATEPIVLDGDLSEWSGVPVLADPKFAVPKFSGTNDSPNYVLFEEYDGGTWTGPDDHTSAVQIVYDEENVFFGFVVTDDYHENSANSAWNGDSVQLMIADAARTNQVALYNYALGGVEGALGEVIVNHEAGPAMDPDCDCATEAVITRDATTKRTTYEIKLPKASLGLTTLKGGPQFGLGMAINDGDELTPGQKGWGGLGAHAIVFGKTPEETALMTLAKGNDIEPGKEFYTALRTTTPIVVDGDLSEWSGVPVLADPKFAVPKFSGTNDSPNYVLFEEYDGGTWTGPDDHTSAVQIVYDEENVFFGFVVTDDYHENSANSAWNGDSVQLMIADAARTNQVALYNYSLGGVEGAVGDVIVMHEAGPGSDPVCDCATIAVVTRDGTTKKTYYEIQLPVESLGLTAPLTVGTQFGLGMAINDGDELTPGQKGWGGLGAHSIVFGKTPEETALVTLGSTVSGTDRMFLSAINPTFDGFSFRANDKGDSIVDPDSAKLIIDGEEVSLTVSPKQLDATDFTYTRSGPYPPGSEHAYTIEVSDTNGNLVTDISTFRAAYYAVLTASMQAVSVDTSEPGFLWKIFQNETYTHTSLAETELALAGQLVDGNGDPVTENLAYPDEIGPANGPGVKIGPLLQFEIPTVINLSRTADTAFGNFTPDDQIPGVPGETFFDEGIDAEVIAFVELPAGWLTMGVNSDDGFRSQVGYINVPADGVLLGEFDGARGASDTTFLMFVQEAGVYPIRTIYVNGTGDANIEIFSVDDEGTKVLLNDTDNGGFETYRSGVAPEKPDIPTDFSISIQLTDGNIEITWTEPGLVLQESTDIETWTDVANATSPYRPVVGEVPVRFYRLRN